ncbi:MAG: hypothetical protein A3E25_17780 [Burkholderiales bacterium RIFCSPHIGHO2_12_FULL_69_20]|nr:MAG: hypothetical protein A3E25_17780 [Burkholderiales bacterium RIFCSPHIGHO2_12_FULL_69_20]
MRTLEHPPLQLQATAGRSLDIVLDSAPGAGLLWQPPAAPAGCTLKAAGHAPGGAGEGAGQQQHFAFEATKPGKWTLRFELRRAWESSAHAVQPVQVTAG